MTRPLVDLDALTANRSRLERALDLIRTIENAARELDELTGGHGATWQVELAGHDPQAPHLELVPDGDDDAPGSAPEPPPATGGHSTRAEPAPAPPQHSPHSPGPLSDDARERSTAARRERAARQRADMLAEVRAVVRLIPAGQWFTTVTVAEQIGRSREPVRRSLDDLAAAGELEHNGKVSRHSRYRRPPAELPAPDPEPSDGKPPAAEDSGTPQAHTSSAAAPPPANPATSRDTIDCTNEVAKPEHPPAAPAVATAAERARRDAEQRAQEAAARRRERNLTGHKPTPRPATPPPNHTLSPRVRRELEREAEQRRTPPMRRDHDDPAGAHAAAHEAAAVTRGTRQPPTLAGQITESLLGKPAGANELAARLNTPVRDIVAALYRMLGAGELRRRYGSANEHGDRTLFETT